MLIGRNFLKSEGIFIFMNLYSVNTENLLHMTSSDGVTLWQWQCRVK